MSVESVTQAVCNLAMQFGEGEDAESGTMVSTLSFSRLSSLLPSLPFLAETNTDSFLQSRPFGVALLFGGLDTDGPTKQPVLYHADPSGTYIRYHAKAIGPSLLLV